MEAISPDHNHLSHELEELGRTLETRQSITWVARAFVCACVGIISFGVSMRLLADSARLPKFFWPILAVFLGTTVYSFFAAFRSRALMAKEHEQFGRYRELRQKAGLS